MSEDKKENPKMDKPKDQPKVEPIKVVEPKKKEGKRAGKFR